MNTPHDNRSPSPQDTPPDPPAMIAVWCFVGATFLFALPITLFPGAPPWVRIVTTVLGFVAIVLGGARLHQEMSSLREKTSDTRAAGDEPPHRGGDR